MDEKSNRNLDPSHQWIVAHVHLTFSLFAATFVAVDNLCKQFGPRSGPTEKKLNFENKNPAEANKKKLVKM